MRFINLLIMRYIADFHIHSKYSRATSPKTNVENLAKWAKIKGISILSTGDFTHPEWLRELKEKLEPAETGLFKLKDSFWSEAEKSASLEGFVLGNGGSGNNSNNSLRYILSSEISCIYSKNGRVRKIHYVILAPDFETVDKINVQLSFTSNLKSDGRPILGMDSKELLKIVLNASKNCFFIPAHCMTPWFGIFGSKSGFDSVEECFEELTPHIFAIETGLSADPLMLWRMSILDNITLVSNSDAHSPQKLGREANIFEGESLSYESIVEAMKKKNEDRTKDCLRLVSTAEFFPEEGKYHYDGHRNCEVRFSPEERKKHGGICPNCGKPLTIGVLSRVDELADRAEGEKPDNAIPFKKLIPLPEIIAESFGQSSSNSKTVDTEYKKLINQFGSEFEILLRTSVDEIAKISLKVSQGIEKVRNESINLLPGYDGEFGKVQIFQKEEKEETSKQKSLF